jgi:hypothetical protein
VNFVNPASREHVSITSSNADMASRREFQMRAVLSRAVVTTRIPSGLKAAEVTSLSWPRRTAISLAVAASQIRAVLSYDAVTMRFPSGLKAAETTQSSWPRRTAIS